MKVLVIEDGDIGRLGRTAALDAAGHEVTATKWSDLGSFAVEPFDVVVPVLSPDPTSWDRYHVLSTMASLSGSLGPSTATVGVVDRDAFGNPLLNLRLERAGIERVADSTTIKTVEHMHEVVTVASSSVPTHPTDMGLLGAGVARGADPDAVVAWVLDRLASPLGDQYRNAFDPRFTQAACGLSRRQAHTVRSRLAGLGRIRPSQSCSGGGPVRDRSLPRWNEVINVANLCRGFEFESVGDVLGGVGGQVETWRAA